MSEEDVEEQVVGAMAWCDTCAAKTVHVDGKCREHKVIRRKKPRPARKPEPEPEPRRGISRFTLVAVALVLIGGYFLVTRVLGYGYTKSVETVQTPCSDQETEITRLTQENLSLRSQISDLEAKLRAR